MRQCFLLFSFLIFLSSPFAQAQSKPDYGHAFQPGEHITYIVAYNWFIMYTEVGEITMSLEESNIYGKPAWHYIGYGTTWKLWDKMFKVRDKYETWVEPETLSPYYFQRNIREGSFTQHVSYVYNHADTITYSKYQVKQKPMRDDTIKITHNTVDVMTALLQARNIDFSKSKEGDKIPVTIILDQEIYELYFRFLGKEIKKVKGFGHVKCNKFTVMLVEGTMFNEGEDMNMWVTDDKNNLPVLIETPILVGSVKVRVVDIQGNKYPLTSME